MFLLDTNVVSELRKAPGGRADPGVVAWASAASVPDLFISVITLQELELGVLLAERRDPTQGEVLRAWLDNDVADAFARRVIPIDSEVARRAARLHVPDPQPLGDSLIAATALAHDMTVVTRNEVDFASTGAAILNPWSA